MFRDIFFHLFLNLLYFLSFGYLLNRVTPFTLSKKSSFKAKLIYSTIFGLSSVGAIFFSYDLAGVKVDIRLVSIALAGLYGGPLTAFLTSLWPVVYRILISGVTEITVVAAVTMITSGLLAGFIGSWYLRSPRHQIVGSFLLATFYSVGLYVMFPSNQHWESFLSLVLVFGVNFMSGILITINQAEFFLEGYKLRGELQAQRNRLTAVLDSVDEGVIVTDLQGQVIHVSKRAESLLEFNGYPQFNVLNKEANGEYPPLMDVIVNSQEYQETVKSIKADPAVTFESVFNLYAEYGKVIKRYTSPVIDNEFGKILGRVFVYRDVTAEYQRELEKNQLIEVTKEQAVTDHLTSLYNTKYLDEYLSKELALESNLPLSMLILDVDKFKRINDTYGHSVGDEILLALAKNIETTVRNSDIVGRYGGEEFEVLLPKTNYESALKVAEKVRKSVDDQRFITSVGELRITISIGVATCPAHGIRKMELFKSGDKALYKAKEWGRNQVVGFQQLLDESEGLSKAETL